MASLIFIFGLLDYIISVFRQHNDRSGVSFSGRRSTEEFESLPYICKLLNAYFWVWYGIVKPNSVLVASVNGFGAVLEIIYVLIFLVFAPPRIKAKTAILAGVLDVVFPGAAVLVTELFFDRDVQIKVSGFLSLCFSMVAYGSPLSAMKTVVVTKSVEYMPFLLSFILFINGAVWTVYAFLTKDAFIGIPNGSGFILGTAQLILYAMYWKPKSSKKISGDLEDGWQHQTLISSN
ncbi:Bidirectional sugar transporter SWEET [Melia azedarach]|uniref:Bidirectional sugar transporter SWEET n=1 Tax=Melia azedarach TaxID=155640 RepID=A0ACC1Y845_MELAZ|nr:Bidirectional sugar transporter SWEET [Melia azedarach]